VSERPIVSNAREIDAVAADWLQRRDFWNWSEADQAALEAWLSESVVHRVAFVRLQTGWGRTERLAALRPVSGGGIGGAWRGQVVPTFIRAAAALCVCAVAGFLAFRQPASPQEKIYTASLGNRESINLTDGSQIDLNTNTSVRTLIGGGERKVWLEHGEAYFQVKHDAAHPFVVIAGNRRITDLGTKFLVRREGDELKVSVIEGKVQLDAAGAGAQPQSTELNPGEVAIAKNETLSVFSHAQKSLTDQLGWRRGVVVFNHTTLATAVAEFNRYNDHKIVIADATTANLAIGGTFRTTDLESFIDVTQHVLGLHVVNQGNKTVISR
jgi:transmembrane sensor